MRPHSAQAHHDDKRLADALLAIVAEQLDVARQVLVDDVVLKVLLARVPAWGEAWLDQRRVCVKVGIGIIIIIIIIIIVIVIVDLP